MFLSKLFKRNAEAKEHLKDNRGDENVTKMIWVVIVFVVGALLLTIVSGAFSGKVADWYNDTTDSWFNEGHGMYTIEGGNAGGTGDGGAQAPDSSTVAFTIRFRVLPEDEWQDTLCEVAPGTTWGEWLDAAPVINGYGPLYMQIDEEDGLIRSGSTCFGPEEFNAATIYTSTTITAGTYYVICY